MNKNKFKFQLVIPTQDEHPEIVTQMTGVNPTGLTVKGAPYVRPRDKKTIKGVFEKHNTWFYYSDYKLLEDGEYLDTVISDLLDFLDLNKEQFRAVFSKYEDSYIVCCGYYYDFHFYYTLSPELTKRLNDYNILLEFDYYYLGHTDKRDKNSNKKPRIMRG